MFSSHENRTNQQNFRQFVGIAALVAFGLVVTAGSGEIFLRLIGYSPPVLLPLHIRDTYKLEIP